MTSEVGIKDEAEFRKALKELKSDDSTINLVIVGHVDNDPRTIEIVYKGPDVAEATQVVDENQVMYVVERINETVELSTTVKYALITWIGPRVPFAKRGKFGVVAGSVKQQLQMSFHAEIKAESMADLNQEVVLKIIAESSGTKSM